MKPKPIPLPSDPSSAISRLKEIVVGYEDGHPQKGRIEEQIERIEKEKQK